MVFGSKKKKINYHIIYSEKQYLSIYSEKHANG